VAADPAHFCEAHQEWPPEVKLALATHLISAAGPVPRRCLFLGAGTGVNDALPFARLADPRDKILASDVEPAYLDRLRELAQAQGLRNVEARRIDIGKDLANLGAFDLVTLLFVIHRLADWQPVVPHLAALVAPAGSLYLSEFAGPSGVIYLSNEGGGRLPDPVSRLIRRYFELLPDPFSPSLKSTSIRPVREALAERLTPSGYRDFLWPQQLTVGEMCQKIESRAYAPYFSTHPTGELLAQLREEFQPDWSRKAGLTETIRVYRFGRP
jgi:SAM-dependent methyltransferase